MKNERNVQVNLGKNKENKEKSRPPPALNVWHFHFLTQGCSLKEFPASNNESGSNTS
jgi:hypothetical protein